MISIANFIGIALFGSVEINAAMSLLNGRVQVFLIEPALFRHEGGLEGGVARDDRGPAYAEASRVSSTFSCRGPVAPFRPAEVGSV